LRLLISISTLIMETLMAANLTEVTNLFGVLSDATRLGIVLLLAKGEANVGTICETLELLQPTASHHLGLLRMNRVVAARRKGKTVIYTLASHVKVSGGKIKIAVPPFSVTLERA